ncbi:hypothetical protein MMC27_005293 [Xylographa pallens]|nr:hypothetical protein [Xylographa pallens]
MRGGWRGVVSVVVGGEKDIAKGNADGAGKEKEKNGKRKAEVLEEGKGEKPVSKREMKRRAKRARQEAHGGEADPGGKKQDGTANEGVSETVSATKTSNPADKGRKDAAKTVSDKVG